MWCGRGTESTAVVMQGDSVFVLITLKSGDKILYSPTGSLDGCAGSN